MQINMLLSQKIKKKGGAKLMAKQYTLQSTIWLRLKRV